MVGGAELIPFWSGSLRFRLSLLLLGGLSCFGKCIAQTTPQISIAFELKQGQPLVHAELNGVPVSLLLDLGGGDKAIVLNPSDAKSVAAHRTESTQSFSSFDGKIQKALGLEFNSVKLGGVDFGAMTGSEMADGGTSYVGAGLLGKKLLVLDYKLNQLRMYESGDKTAMRRECGASTFPVDVVRGVFQSYLLTQGKVLTAAWDTGANFSVIRPSAVNLKIPDYVPGSQPQIHMIQSARLNESTFGALNAALIEFKGPPADLVLGTNFFQGKVVCLDALAHSGGVRQ